MQCEILSVPIFLDTVLLKVREKFARLILRKVVKILVST